jgi:type III secretion system export apparatus protein
MESGCSGMALAALSLRAFGFLLALPFGDALNTFPRFFIAVGLGWITSRVIDEPGEIQGVSLLFEFVIGFLIGAPLRFVVDVSESIGEVIDTARGQTISAVIDPLHGQGSSNLSVLAKNGAIFFALVSGALEVSLRGFVEVARVLPPGELLLNGGFVRAVARGGVVIISEGLMLASVWLGAFLLADLVCALASRLVSGLSFTQTGAILKMFITFIFGLIFISDGVRGGGQWIERTLLIALGGAHSAPQKSGILAAFGG